ncbi:MAG: Fic family protein, partial [Nanoarchaeota archaeon]|nr:Fic family protein [Nanoarchaeota archaeon]
TDEVPINIIQSGISDALIYMLGEIKDREIGEKALFGASSNILSKAVYDYRLIRPHVTGRTISVPNRSELDSFMSTFLFELANPNLSSDRKLEMILGGIPYAQPFEDGNKRLSRVIEATYCINEGLNPIQFFSRQHYIDLLFDYTQKQDELIKKGDGFYVNTNCNSKLLEHIRNN